MIIFSGGGGVTFALTRYCSITLQTLVLRAVVIADIACVVKAMMLRSSAIAISVLSSCIIFLFTLSYEILHPELPCRECDHCGGHSESRVFDYFVPEFVLSSGYFLY